MKNSEKRIGKLPKRMIQYDVVKALTYCVYAYQLRDDMYESSSYAINFKWKCQSAQNTHTNRTKMR